MPEVTLNFESNPRLLQYHFDMVVKDFPWHKAAAAMKLLKIKWYGKKGKKKSVPGERRIKTVVVELLRQLVDDPRPVCYCHTGGFFVTKCGDYLQIRFTPYVTGCFDRLYERVSDQYRIDNLHPLLRKLHDVSVTAWRIGGITYPARTAIAEGLGDNYVAITGDGMLTLLFEIKSLEGDGLLRYHVLKHESNELYPSRDGKLLYQYGVRHNDEMTFDQAVHYIKAAIGEINGEHNGAF